MMTIEELRDAWSRLDGGVVATVDALARDRASTMVQRAMRLPAFELAVMVLGVGFVASGLARGGGGAVFVGSCAFVLAVLAGMIVSAIWQLVMLGRVDAAQPVVATQRRLGRVRAVRIFETMWTLLASPVIWAPFLVVILEVPLRLWFGLERELFAPWFVLANVGIGAVLSVGLFLLSRWLTRRLAGTSFLRGLLDCFAGRRLTAAREFLARIDGFERG